jgi:phage-related protein
MANDIPIDVVLRAQDEMSAVLDKAAKESLELADSFKTAEDAAKKATGITWDETTKRWRDANRGFISSAKALEQGFTEADKAVFKYEKQIKAAAKATDSMGKSMAEGGAASSGFGVKMVALGNIAGDLAMKAFSAVASTVGDVAKAMIDGNAEFERYETQFGVLLGSSDAAKKRLQELAEFGAKTPFELPEVVRADKVLQGFGLHSEEAAKKFGLSGEQIRTLAGDLAAGTGTSFEDMAGYLGRFASGSTGEVISRFQELGITTRDELAKLGLQFSKSGELTTPTAEAFTVLAKVAQDKFGGMMDAQSKTFEGMMSNLEDWKGNTLRTIGEPIFEVLRDKLGVLLQYLSSPEVQAFITDFAKNLADTLRTVVAWVEANWPTIQAIITGVFNGIKFVIDEVLRPVIDFVVGLFDDLVANTTDDFGNIWDSISTVIDGIVDIIDEGLGYVKAFWDDNGAEITKFVQDAWWTISDIINGVVAVIVKLIEIAMPAIKKTISQAMVAARVIFETVWAAIKIVVGGALTLIAGVVDAALALLNGDIDGALKIIKQTFFDIWKTIYETVEDWIDDVKGIIDEKLKESGTSIDGIIKTIRDAFITWATNIRDDMKTWWGNVKQAIVDAVDTFWNGVEFTVNSIRNRFIAWVTGIRDDMIIWWGNVKTAITDAVGLYWAAIEYYTNYIKAQLEAWVYTIKSKMTEWWGDVKKAIVDAVDAIYSPLETAWNNIVELTTRIIGSISGSVKTIWDGVIGGIKSGLNGIIDFYNTNVVPIIGTAPIQRIGEARAGRSALGTDGGAASATTNINLTANYGYQSERSLRDDVQTLQMLYGGA